MSFTPELLQQATALLAAARAKKLKITTAESCTGGLISALLTEVAGSSDVFERGFVTYSNQAKMDLLDVPEELLEANGAVSAPVAWAMAEGAIRKSRANIAVAVTGIAGPGGGSAEKPVGLVYIAVSNGSDTQVTEHRFGDIGRSLVRRATVKVALDLLHGLA
jgi:nicotinamide-nucleotide amidase